jgi:nitrite reductase (cytochrome c-552)
MAEILKDIRRAQWRWDFAAAGHGSSFHAPVETARIVASGIEIAGNARVKLARLLSTLGWNQEIPYPDIETKAKAQSFIGLDMNTLVADKADFIKNILPTWK